MPIFSLPSKYGIGTLGKCAYEFVDFLVETRQTYWQMLPIMHTSFGNSPYSAVSSFAGNPFFIDFILLKNDGLLKESDFDFLSVNSNIRRVDYDLQFEYKFKILKIAFDNFRVQNPYEYKKYYDYIDFFADDYATFLAIKSYFNNSSFDTWSSEFKLCDKNTISNFKNKQKEIIEFYKFIQYKQWFDLKNYANSKGIKIIGDAPIYSAYDSDEVWAHPELFLLDDNKKPIDVAGCPPDGYSELGQLWGNPIYNYKYIEENNFKYFTNKFSHLLKLYDVLRIDHFRGFDSYYAIPYGSPDAKNGRWVSAPGIKLFETIKNNLGDVEIIAEDLGFLTDSVRDLLHFTGFPGMKVLEFAFNSNDKSNTDYLPHTYIENSVAYLGTHDNDTFMGWIHSINENDKSYAIEYLKLNEPSNYYKDALKVLYDSKSNVVITQFQDLLGTGSVGRMNVPSTLIPMNWSYRLLPYELNDEVKNFLKNLTIESNRE